jgi:hypothetical protein
VKFNRATSTKLLVDMTMDVDPTGAELELWVGDAWHPCEWISATTQVGTKYRRTARTTRHFRGMTAEANESGSYTLNRRLYQTKTRLTTAGGDEIVAPSEVIELV